MLQSDAKPGETRRSRASTRVTIERKPFENASVEKESALQATSAFELTNSDSESEDKHSEVMPAADVAIYHEYDMGPAFGCKFPIPFIRFMVERVLKEKLKGKNYQMEHAAKWARDVADTCNMKMKGHCLQHRYKHVINVCLYQQTGAGFYYGFRAVWDTLSDDYITCTLDAGTFVCIVTVFGCYQY